MLYELTRKCPNAPQTIEIGGATVKCVICGNSIPLCRIAQHVAECGHQKEYKNFEPSFELATALKCGVITQAEYDQILRVEMLANVHDFNSETSQAIATRCIDSTAMTPSSTKIASKVAAGTDDNTTVNEDIELCVVQ